MARKKPKGWVKEPVRHGLAAKGIKTGRVKGVTMAQIRSGHARNKYGLDTSSGSRYSNLRLLGYSDEDAQAEIFGVGRESGEPGIGVPLSREDERTPLDVEREEQEELREATVMSLGILSQKAQEGNMRIMTGPRIMEAAKEIRKGDYRMAIGWLNEVAGLGPAEVTRRAKLAIKDIERIQGMG